MNDAPCKDCEERKLGCHSICPRYRDFCEKNEERKERLKEERQQREDFVRSVYSAQRKKHNAQARERRRREQ